MNLPEGYISIKTLLDAIAHHEQKAYEARPIPGDGEPPTFVCRNCNEPVRHVS